MATRHPFLAVVLTMLVWSSTASGQTATDYGVTLLYGVNSDGTGTLIANPTKGGSVSWQACPPGDNCRPVASRPTLDRALDVGTAPAGTVFVATATNGPQTATARSVPYLGGVRSNAPPSIDGTLRVGALIKPVAGSWSGGWGTERSVLQTQICRRANGTGCVVVADQIYWNKCASAGAVLASHHAGRYVRVIEQRLGRDIAFTPVGIPLPSDIEPLEPAPARAATIAGPIRPASGPAESKCGPPPPRVTLARRAVRRGGRLELGRISCVSRCTVRIDVSQKRHRKLSYARTFTKPRGAKRLMLPVRATGRIKAGSFKVSVFFGREMISTRRVTASRH